MDHVKHPCVDTPKTSASDVVVYQKMDRSFGIERGRGGEEREEEKRRGRSGC